MKKRKPGIRRRPKDIGSAAKARSITPATRGRKAEKQARSPVTEKKTKVKDHAELSDEG